MTIIKKTVNNKCWQGCEEIGTCIQCWWKCKMIHLLWKTVRQFLEMLNLELPCDSAILFLDIYPKELKTYVHTKTCTHMFIAALFIMLFSCKVMSSSLQLCGLQHAGFPVLHFLLEFAQIHIHWISDAI